MDVVVEEVAELRGVPRGRLIVVGAERRDEVRILGEGVPEAAQRVVVRSAGSADGLQAGVLASGAGSSPV